MGVRPRFLFGRRRWFFAYPFVAFVVIICIIASSDLLSSTGKKGENTPDSANALSGLEVTKRSRLIARDDTWDDRVEKGRKFKCLFEAKNEADAQKENNGIPVASTFLDYGDLYRWGYFANEDQGSPSFGGALDDAYKDLGIDPSNNVENTYIHACRGDTWFKKRTVLNDDGEIVPPTMASFFNIVNPQGGAIIADINVSPRNQKPGLSVYPDLQQWSDVVFLSWQKNSAWRIRDLKYCINAKVTNDDTQNQVITAYTNLKLPTIGTYQNRVTFLMTDEAGLAIMGSKNGAACAYLVVAHKLQLGLKRITQVTTWANTEWTIKDGDRDALQLYMYFDIDNVK